ncbi:MAG: ABC transporter substrate-binding protein [Acidimicrobiia bacterium]
MQHFSRSWARLAALVMVLVACGGGGSATTTTAGTTTTGATTTAATDTTGAGGEPIRIATSLPLTGEFSVPAIKHRDGFQLCVNLINDRGGMLDRPVELIVEDSRSDETTAINQYERFITTGAADVLFGTFSSALTFGTSAVAEQNDWVYPVPSGGAGRIWERGFQNLFYFQQGTAEVIGASPIRALEHYRDTGLIPEADFPQTAALINADDFFAIAIAAGLAGDMVELPGTDPLVTLDLSPGWLAEADIEPVVQQSWPTGEFGDWINLANTVQAADADIVFVGTASVEEAVEVVTAFQTIGYQPKLLYMSQGAQSEFRDDPNIGDAANGIIIHTSWHAAANFESTLAGEPYGNFDFIADFEAVHGRPPDEDEAIPFAVCQGMEQAILATGGTDQAALREFFATRTADDPVQTVLGEFRWNEKGLPIERSHILVQWQDGELQAIFPAVEGTVDMIYPKPEW